MKTGTPLISPKNILAFIGGFAVMMSIAFMGYTIRGNELPVCPQEDSCTIDYVNGHWEINGVTVTR